MRSRIGHVFIFTSQIHAFILRKAPIIKGARNTPESTLQMSTLVSYYLYFMAIILVIYIIGQTLKRKEDIASLRNFFIAGLIIFQIAGAANSMLMKDVGHFHPANIDSTSVIYSAMLTVFVIILLSSYQMSTKYIDKIFSRYVKPQKSYSPMGIMVISICIIGFGVASQYVLSYIPVLGPGFHKFAYGMYAIGAGMASWAAAPRLWNPVYFLMAAFVILLALGLTLSQAFGRRELLGVVLAVLWALYFSHWRSFGFRRVFVRMSVVSFGGLILLSLFTSARSGDFLEQSAMENISSLKNASAGDGMKEMLYGQRAGLNSMWLIESRPDSHPYDTLHSLKLLFSFPIPRSSWPGKPNALGITMPKYEIKVAKRPEEWNIGPGLVGHIANDNPYLALWMYPIIIGVAMRFCDRAVAWFSANPFIVLPVGAAIGQFIAMPRGELGSFSFNAIINILGALFIMNAVSWVLTLFGWIKTEDHSWDETEQEWDDGAYSYSSENEYRD
jgi:hypothetical protein